MISLKVWYYFSLCFCFYNLKLLLDDRYLLSYYLYDDYKNFIKSINLFVCLDFDRIKDLNETINNPNKKLVDNKEFIDYAIDKISFNLPEIFIPNNKSSIFIFKKHICILIDDANFYRRSIFIPYIKNAFKVIYNLIK